MLKECSEANSGQTVLLKQQLMKKNEQNTRLQQEKEELRRQMKDEHGEIARVVEQNKHVTTPMKRLHHFMRHIVRRESLLGMR